MKLDLSQKWNEKKRGGWTFGFDKVTEVLSNLMEELWKKKLMGRISLLCNYMEQEWIIVSFKKYFIWNYYNNIKKFIAFSFLQGYYY